MRDEDLKRFYEEMQRNQRGQYANTGWYGGQYAYSTETDSSELVKRCFEATLDPDDRGHVFITVVMKVTHNGQPYYDVVLHSFDGVILEHHQVYG